MTLSGSLFHVLYDIEEQIIFNDWSNCRLVMLHYLKRFLFETNMVHTEYLKSNKQDRERERERAGRICCMVVHITDTYVVGSKSFRPDQLFKVTEIKQICYFST